MDTKVQVRSIPSVCVGIEVELGLVSDTQIIFALKLCCPGFSGEQSRLIAQSIDHHGALTHGDSSVAILTLRCILPGAFPGTGRLCLWQSALA